MNLQVFDGDDNAYLRWMDANPLPFVLNTQRNRTSTYAVLHKPKCHHITTTVSLPKGAYTERDYIKVCADDVQSIKEWLDTNRPDFKEAINECRTCKPLVAKYLDQPVLLFPELLEDEEKQNLLEGAARTITVNAYERNPRARQQCLKYHGTRCKVCGLDFEEQYGEIGRAFIHVHHLTPLYELGSEYVVNPITDLCPVCPNCHAMLHQRKPCYTIEELQGMMKR